MRRWSRGLMPLAMLVVAACGDGPSGNGTEECTLRSLADRAGVRIGAAFVEGRNDPPFRTTLAREFNSITAPLYWAETQPTSDAYHFAVADTAVDIGASNRMRVRGHPLIWGRLALPEYVRAATDPEALRAMVADRIATIVGRYAGRIAQYDVVNEPLTLFGTAGNTNGLDDNVFHRVLGPGYIREALELAHAADPAAKLYVNDFLVEKPGPKQDRLFDLARGLLESGAPLHGIGMQGHIRLPVVGPEYEPTAAEIESAVRRFAGLGLEVEITELDVTLTSRDPSQLDLQRRVYHDVFAGCLAAPGCTGVTVWGITDRFTWISNFFQVDGAPLLFDEDYAPKPAYFGVRDALLEKVPWCGT